MINAAADWRHPRCCDESSSGLRPPPSRVELEAEFIAMFREEWALARGDAPLRSIAIVDDDPHRQFLFPEFELFARLFAESGIECLIADARELEIADRALRWRGRTVDLVYNRVTDFDLADPTHVALREAWITDAAVITPHPHPRAHALRADKRVLTFLSDEGFLTSIGVDRRDRETLLAGVPRARLVGHEQDWWQDREGWFFKPATGFGSRGAYRGDKITRRVFDEVSAGGYVAQEFVPPSGRRHPQADLDQAFKVDVRNYVYDGRVMLLAARLYRGQTTNFRTAGGGFAAVLETGRRAGW